MLRKVESTENITVTATLTDIATSDLKLYSSAISTSAAEGKALRITAKNNTDDTEIDASGNAKYWDVSMNATVINTRKELETNWNDHGDDIIFQHSVNSDYVPDSSIYIRTQAIKPINVLNEDDML